MATAKDIAVAGAATTAAVVGALVLRQQSSQKKSAAATIPAVLQDATLGPPICALLAPQLDRISGESLIKLTRQLQFWYAEKSLSQAAMLALTQDLIATATICHTNFTVPKVRFGKTELQMPIVTCGGMRVQTTWLPDFTPISKSKTNIVQHASQDNLLRLLRLCFKMGITHFETARLYGTSEVQFSEALYTLMQNGEIKREDFILQTKIAATPNRADFEKLFEQSWANFGARFGYIDLLSFWCASKQTCVSKILAEGPNTCIAAVLAYQKQGKIKHIGFSTHGTAAHILELINSEKFSYVNLHCHAMGSYHAQGTPDGLGGHGNAAAVKRALELDMGVFNISPLDKGGRVYQPSKTLVRLLGPQMSPIAFVNLTSWQTQGFHTVSVGFAMPSDVEETAAAARRFSEEPVCATDIKVAEGRLAARMEERVGKDWMIKGLLNLPTCEQEETDGTAIGHVLWCYNLVKAFGMYDFAKARYKSLEDQKWSKKATFAENADKVGAGNMGRCYQPDFDYRPALAQHFDPEAALAKMAEVHSWLSKKANVDREALECEVAYDLRVWMGYPGDDVSVTGVVLQNLTFGILGCGGGPTKSAAANAAALRNFLHLTS
jgi:hypothetical protein